MAANAGRTTFKYTIFLVDNAAGTLTQLPELIGLSAVGVTYDEVDVSAWADAVKNALPGMPDAPITARFRLSTTAITHLSGILGLMTPLSLDIRMGIRDAWEAGEPQFGITADTEDGYILTSLTVNPDDQTMEAKFVCIGGAILPAFGTAAET